MNLKRLFLLLCFVAYRAGENFAVQSVPDPDIIQVPAVATSSDCFTLDDGKTIRVYNDVLQVGESYIVTLDIINDLEPINYMDLETYELEKMEVEDHEKN